MAPMGRDARLDRIATLRQRALECRRLATLTRTPQAALLLEALAHEAERDAAHLMLWLALDAARPGDGAWKIARAG